MPGVRYILIGLVAFAICLIAIYFYRTQTPPNEAPASFGGVSLYTDVADTPETRELGLGGHEGIPENYGMLFVFPEKGRHGLWMKDMKASIDIFWLTSDGHVVGIEENVTPSTYPSVFYPPEPVYLVLETAAGFAKAHNIGPEDVFSPLPFPK